jgi:hypothetical protein
MSEVQRPINVASSAFSPASSVEMPASDKVRAWRRNQANFALMLSVAAAAYTIYCVIRAIAGDCQGRGPLTSTCVAIGGSVWKLLTYYGSVFALAVATGWLWRAGRLQWRRSLLHAGTAALTIAAWVTAILKLSNKWFRIAHDNVTCDGVLLLMLVVCLAVLLVGTFVGLGRRQFSRIEDRRWLLATAAIWLAIICAADQMTALFSVTFTLATAAVLGLLLLRRLRLLQDLDPLDAALLSIGLGLCPLTLATLLIGHLHLLYWWIFAPAFAAIFYIGYREFPTLWKSIPSQIGNLGKGSFMAGNPLWGSLALIVGIMLTVALIGNVGPEVIGDAIGGRLGEPMIYVRNHLIEPRPIGYYTYQTCGSEMLTTLAILFGGQMNAGKMMHFVMGALSLLAVFALGRKWQDWRIGLIATACVATSTVIWWLLTTAYTDLTFLLLGLLASFALYYWLAEKKTSWLAVSGLLMGFTCGVKLTGGFIVCAGLLTICGASLTLRRDGWKKTLLSRAAVYGLCASVGILPWLVRSFIYTGNPVWPHLLLHIMDPALPDWYNLGYPFLPGSTLEDYLRIPLRAVFHPELFIEHGGFSSLLLTLLPALAGLGILLCKRRLAALIQTSQGDISHDATESGIVPNVKIWFAIFVIVMIALWIATDINLRYGLVQLSLLSVLTAGLLGLSWRLCGSAVRKISQAALFASVAAALLFAILYEPWMKFHQDGVIFGYRVLLGTETPEARADRLQPTRMVTNYLNRSYSSHARVLCTVNYDVLYMKSESVAWLWMGKMRELATLLEPQTPRDEIHRLLQEMGITHLMCRESELRDNGGNPWLRGALSSQFVEDPKYCQLEFAAKGYYLYRVLPADQSDNPASPGPNLLVDPGFDALKQNPQGWQVIGRSPADDFPAGQRPEGTAACVDSGNYVQQTVAVHEGALYRLLTRMITDSSKGKLLVEVVWTTAGGEVIYAYDFAPIDARAQLREVIQYESAPLGAKMVTVKVRASEPDDRVWVDEARLACMEH